MITVDHLSKSYGDLQAVKDLSFEIEEGHVYGFLGPNGAGKSTTMNIMTGCLSATQGCVKIDGYDIFEEPDKAKRLIGYLPEQPPLYPSETPVEYLRFVGEAKGLRREELARQVSEVIRQTRIGDVAHRRIAALSKGYKQRVGIAQALLGDPKAIILDEPTVGLDPIQIIEIRDLIKELGRTHTVIFSSHILSEVQTICDQILMIAGGRLAAFGDPESLKKRLLSPSEVTVAAEGGRAEVEKVLSGLPRLTGAEYLEGGPGRVNVRLRTDSEDVYLFTRSVFLAFSAKKIPLLELSPKKTDLEDVFLELTEGGGVQDGEGKEEVL